MFMLFALVMTSETLQLPWATTNEDLVELFQTTGKVENAEIVFENGRSKGTGIVQFSNIEEAQSAISKFRKFLLPTSVRPQCDLTDTENYSYGNRPLALDFNARYIYLFNLLLGLLPTFISLDFVILMAPDRMEEDRVTARMVEISNTSFTRKLAELKIATSAHVHYLINTITFISENTSSLILVLQELFTNSSSIQ